MMPVRVRVAAATITIALDDYVHELPFGSARLAAELAGDPPRPEQLTNAIGAVIDHVDDLVRMRPDVLGRAVEMSGPLPYAVACVEAGSEVTLPFTLPRDAAEEVFRTVATEPAADRRHNPGLAPEMIDTVVAGCCVVVGVARRLQLDELVVVDEACA
jgi:exopolyphosphatase/guanosine-5'-triphosphate,3'-diphosphate pyrophosphatase